MPSTYEIYQMGSRPHDLKVELTLGHASTSETSIRIDHQDFDGVQPDSFVMVLPAGQIYSAKKLEISAKVVKHTKLKIVGSVIVNLSGGVIDAEFKLRDSSPLNPVVFLFSIDLF